MMSKVRNQIFWLFYISIHENVNLKILRMIPGPRSLPIIGAQWMYWKIVGIYKYEKYHEANEEKLKNFGTVVREDVIWNFPLIHIFDSKVITSSEIHDQCAIPTFRTLILSFAPPPNILSVLQMRLM